MRISIIACVDSKGGIGREGTLPWKFGEDLRFFKQKTMHRYVIMGRVTWEGISGGLPDRHPIVITSQPDYKVAQGEAASSLEHAFNIIPHYASENVWVAGGERVYREALPFAHRILLTEIDDDFECDRFFPPLTDAWQWKEKGSWMESHTGLKYRRVILTRD